MVLIGYIFAAVCLMGALYFVIVEGQIIFALFLVYLTVMFALLAGKNKTIQRRKESLRQREKPNHADRKPIPPVNS